MDFTDLRAQLNQEFALLRTAVASTPPDARVPSCPDWSVADLAGHIAEVYRHKAAAIRLNAWPKPWPPRRPTVAPEADLDLAYAELTGQLDIHSPADPAATWHDPDQTVGFWIRRMAQESVIHRVDAELAANRAAGREITAISAIDEALAVDGIDEVLRLFLAYGSTTWPDEFAAILDDADRRPVGLSAGTTHWTVIAAPKSIEVTQSTAAEAPSCAARAEADPAALLLWLWNRADDDAIELSGVGDLLGQFRRLRIIATQ
jgi:uncharacterized protein (TIGR03083 family)